MKGDLCVIVRKRQHFIFLDAGGIEVSISQTQLITGESLHVAVTQSKGRAKAFLKC